MADRAAVCQRHPETFAGTLPIITFRHLRRPRPAGNWCWGVKDGIISRSGAGQPAGRADERFVRGCSCRNWQQALSAIRSLAQARCRCRCCACPTPSKPKPSWRWRPSAADRLAGEIPWPCAVPVAGQVPADLRVTGNRRQNALPFKAGGALKGFGGIFTGTFAGQKWAEPVPFPLSAPESVGRRLRGWTPWKPPPTGAMSTTC